MNERIQFISVGKTSCHVYQNNPAPPLRVTLNQKTKQSLLSMCNLPLTPSSSPLPQPIFLNFLSLGVESLKVVNKSTMPRLCHLVLVHSFSVLFTLSDRKSLESLAHTGQSHPSWRVDECETLFTLSSATQKRKGTLFPSPLPPFSLVFLPFPLFIGHLSVV